MTDFPYLYDDDFWDDEDDVEEYGVPAGGYPPVFYVDNIKLPTPVTLKPGDKLTVTYTITLTQD